MTLSALVLSLSLSLAASPTDAVQFVHDTWGTKEGLPQSSVTAVLQTSDGYLWLGTLGGLARFDGVRFELFLPSTHPGLVSSRIRTLFEDRHKTLWIGTEDGGLIKYEHGAFTSVAAAELRTTTVNFIAAAPGDGLWLGTPLGLFEVRGGAVTPHRRQDGTLLTPETQIIQDDAGELWLGTRWGLVRYSPTRLTTYTKANGLPDDTVQALLKAHDGSLWIATRNGVAHWVKGAVVRVYRRELTNPDVSALHEDAAGGVWIGSRTGLDRIANGDVTPLSAAPPLAPDHYGAITSDREGNIWAGTTLNGLVRLKQARVTMLQVSDTARASVVPITEDRDGAVWVGGTCVGLLRYRDGERRLFTSRDGLPADCIWSLLADRDGALWVGTWGGGLSRMANGKVHTFTHLNSGLRHDVVLALFQDRHGTIWVGTQGGLHTFKNGAFTAYRVADGLVHDDVRFITEDRQGGLWIATTNGVSHFVDGRFTNYTTANGLAHNSVRAIHEDADGTVWIGSYGGGLTRLKDGRFAHISAADGLLDDVVSRILEDNRGFLWMSGNRGIFRASRESLNAFADGRARSVASISYGVTDGMTNHETNGGAQPAGWKARDGRLWFPTVDGAAIIDPRAPDNALAPPIAIERVTIDDRELDLSAPIVLPSGRRRIEIAYTALSLTAPETAQFRYQLEGYEPLAVEAGTRRVAYYTNLPPGQYVFRAAGNNNDGVWNSTGATLAITVRAPFWMSWWFRVSAALTLAALAYAAHRGRIATLNRRQRLHEAFTRQLIDSQEAERARIARELHDTLGQSLVLIKNQAQLSLNRPPDARAGAITEISTMATQAITEVKEIAYGLRPYQLDGLGLTKALDALIARVAGSTTLRIQARVANIDDVLSHEAETTLYRIVQESINNVLKHAQATELEVTFERDERAVRACIRDNGRGFDLAAARRAPGGMGLAGMSERAAMLGATLEVLSSRGHGTFVTVTIPTRGPNP